MRTTETFRPTARSFKTADGETVTYWLPTDDILEALGCGEHDQGASFTEHLLLIAEHTGVTPFEAALACDELHTQASHAHTHGRPAPEVSWTSLCAKARRKTKTVTGRAAAQAAARAAQMSGGLLIAHEMFGEAETRVRGRLEPDRLLWALEHAVLCQAAKTMTPLSALGANRAARSILQAYGRSAPQLPAVAEAA